MEKRMGSIDINKAIEQAVKLPGVKINREEFLKSKFISIVSADDLEIILVEGPYKAGVKQEVIDNIAKSTVHKETFTSSSASFVAGMPGGIAMAATIPADTLQFLGVAMRIAQELAYLYGYKDLWLDEHLDLEASRNEMILFLGVMFGVGGASSTVKFISSGFSQVILKKLPQKALTKTVYYPVIKKVLSYIGVKLTKASFAKGVSKIVPVLGGVVSGSITYATMKTMGNRLAKTLSDSLTLSMDDVMDEYRVMKDSFPDIIDIDFEEVT